MKYKMYFLILIGILTNSMATTASSLSSKIDVVAFSATTATGTSIATGGAGTIIPFDQKQYDTHAAYDPATGLFRVPVSGKYTISVGIQYSANATGYRAAKIQKNGTDYRYLNSVGVCSNVDGCFVTGTTDLALISGDTISIFGEQSSGAGLTLTSVALTNWLTIKSFDTN